MTNATAVALALLLVGCAEWEKEHPYGLLGDLGVYPSFEAQARLAERAELAKVEAAKRGLEPGQIGVGDTQEYVRLQWGVPVDVRTSVVGNTVSEWWEYVTGQYSSAYVHFVDGKVYAIHQ